MGTVYASELRAGSPGQYTPGVLSWGNQLGGSGLSKIFSSNVRSVRGVTATVFGIEHNSLPVFALDATGAVGMDGEVSAKTFTASAGVAAPSIELSGIKISAGAGIPKATCSVGDLYTRKDGTIGSTLYSCTSVNTWTAMAAASH